MPLIDLPVLYSFRRCPYAIRARIALAYTGIPCELREVVLKNKPAEMLFLSRKEKVPILQLTDGTVIDESLDIMLWAIGQHDPDGWLNIDSDTRHETMALISHNDGDFKNNLDRYKYWTQFPDKPQASYRTAAEPFLAQLESRLMKTPFLFGARVTLADVALFPFIRQFSKVDIVWFQQTSYQHLQNWLAYFEQCNLFLGIMQKHKPWVAASPPVVFKPA